MGVIDFGKKVIAGAWDAATSPVRFLYHSARVVGNAVQLAAATVGFGDPSKEWADLKDSLKGAAFSGVTAVLTYGTLGAGALLRPLAVACGSHGAFAAVKDTAVITWKSYAAGTASAMVEAKLRES
jgi:hypothetical protein